MASTTAVAVEGVSHVYNQHEANEVQVLTDIELEVARGEVLVLLGQSGSGKTTLLEVMSGIKRPTAGVVRLFGADLAARSSDALAGLRASEVRFINQEDNLLPYLNAVENVQLMATLAGQPASEAAALAGLDRLGIDAAAARRRPSELSGGQRQRVAIARAEMGSPGLILADEPTARLDAGTSAAVSRALVETAERLHACLVVVTHDQAMGERVGSRTVVVEDGRIVSDSSLPCSALGAAPCSAPAEVDDRIGEGADAVDLRADPMPG